MRKYAQWAKLLKTLAHPVRLQILEILTDGPQCVCDLTAQLKKRQPYISQQLAILREAGLVTTVQKGWNVIYYLDETEFTRFWEIVQLVYRFSSNKMNVALSVKAELSSSNNNIKWHGVPRSEIEWWPTLAVEHCTGCGLCAISCHRNVYGFDYERNRPVVMNPQWCLVGCVTCASLCSQDAIKLPDRGYLRQIIRKKRILPHSKDVLEADRATYDIRLKQVPKNIEETISINQT